MNCQPGDLAYITARRQHADLGKIVRCLRLATIEELRQKGTHPGYSAVWVIN